MPELPEVEFVRRMLEPAMAEARVDAALVRRANLRIPFPPGFVDRLVGQRVAAVERRAKFLLITLSSGETLLVHLGMSGWFRVEALQDGPGRFGAPPSTDNPKHDHVVFEMSSGALVTFNDPRRFGLMDLVPRGGLATHPMLRSLGPEPLSPAFDATALASACAKRKVAVKVALLDQRVVAGVGNIYASEALFVAKISPKRRASRLAARPGTPTPAAVRLTAAIVKVLADAVDRPRLTFRVYDRAGQGCPRRGCHGRIARIVQAARSTFYCPRCQT